MAANINLQTSNFNLSLSGCNSNFTLKSNSDIEEALFNPIARYSFEEGSETIAIDSIEGNNGTISGATYTTGIVGTYALSFDGISNKVTIADNTALNPTTAMSLSLWFKSNKSTYITTTIEAENTTGNTTGDNWTTFRRGRAGIDATGTLVTYDFTNIDYGSKTLIIQGYGSTTAVNGVTYKITDIVTSEVLVAETNMLTGRTTNGLYLFKVFNVKGNNYRVEMFFKNIIDIYIDYLQITGGKDEMICKANAYDFLLSDKNLRFNLFTPLSLNVSVIITMNNDWHHFVATYDGSNIKLYMDNVLKITQADTGTIATNTNSVTFGFGEGFGGYCWGLLDEVLIYKNKALNSIEVSTLFNKGIRLKPIIIKEVAT